MANTISANLQTEDWNVNMSDAWQVLWWCRYLGLTKSQLEGAIQAVGTVIVDIKRYVARQHSLKTDKPPVKPAAAAGHITSRYTLNRSPF